jgi:type I restriction enzyme S subunit
LPPGTILVAASGTLGYTQILGVEGCAHDGWLILQNLRDADRDFLYYALKTLERHFFNMASGAAIQNINTDILRQSEIQLPPLPIQRRIASILGAYDDLIEVNRRRIAVLEEMARRLFDEWFVHFRFPGHEGHRMVETEHGRLPEGWHIRRLQEVGRIITGKTPSKVREDFYEGAVPFVKIPDMHGKMFILDTSDRLSDAGAATQANKTIPAGTLCVSCIGTIGLVSITTERCQTNQQINAFIPQSEEILEYGYFVLKSARQELLNLGSNGATMGNVNKEKFQSLKIVVPAGPIVGGYHNVAASMFGGILNLSKATKRLAASRDLLLPRLISGELSVTEAEHELDAAA